MSRFRQTKIVSFRLEEKTIKFLDEIASRTTKGNRTWVLENIIKEYETNNEITKNK
jgi:predicted transcriptional regulator